MEALDQLVELVSLIIGIVLVFLSIVSSILQIPPVAFFTQILNILISIMIWIGYKIARVKLSIDLRLWVIVEGVTIAYFILLYSFVIIPSTLTLTNNIPPLIFSGLFMLLIFLIDVVRAYIVKFVYRKWELIKGNINSESYFLDKGALYLVESGPMDSLVYPGVGLAFAWLILSAYQNPIDPLLSIIPFPILSIVLVYMLFWKIRRSQKKMVLIYQNGDPPVNS